MKIKTDLHNHLANFTYKRSFNEVVDIIYKRLGSDGILGIVNGYDDRYENFTNLKTSYKKTRYWKCNLYPREKYLNNKRTRSFHKTRTSFSFRIT